MFNLKKIFPVLQHLKYLSKVYDDRGKEIIIHCQFCDDATRPNAMRHGHLYLATDSPIFKCFRCDMSGSLVKFLILTDFKDDETLKYISSFIHLGLTKDYLISSIKKINNNEIAKNTVRHKTLEFIKNNRNDYELFKNYLTKRLHSFNFIDFLICPDFLDKKLVCNFINSANILTVSRYLTTNSNIRYFNHGKNFYHFQDFDVTKNYSFTIAEGPFDILSLYLYNVELKGTIYFSVCGNGYINIIEKLIIENLLIGEYLLNVIFDGDVKNKELTIFKIKKLASNLNSRILIKFYIPLPLFKDVGDYPAITEITNGRLK